MKWDIDTELLKLEPETIAGTQIVRVYMDVSIMLKEGLRPTPAQKERGAGLVWSIALGQIRMPKAFFYGQTIRQAFLRACKAMRKPRALLSPWGDVIKVRGQKVKRKVRS
jgi:hypothetical protein